jgi:hypothetical protein
MSAYTVSIRIDASAAEAGSRAFLAAVERVQQGFDGLGGSGQQIERATQALWSFKRARDAIESAAGVGSRSDSAQRAADIQAYGNEIDRLRAKYVPLAAEQQQYLANLREIREAQRAGALSAVEAASAIDRTKAAFAGQVTALRTAGEAMRATGQSAQFLQNRAQTLVYTLSDVSASLASGASPFMILMQQGGQVAQVFTKAAGGPGLLATAMGVLTSPIALAVTGIAAFAGVTALAVLRASDLSAESRLFAGELQATGRQAEITTKQLHAMVEAMRDANVSKNDARAAISATLRTPGLDSARVSQIAAMTPDAAVALGSDAATAAKALADIAANGYPAIEKFALANNALDAAQLKVIRSMAQQGDQVGAVDRALQGLSAQYSKLAEGAMSDADKAFLRLGRAWTGFIDAVAQSKPVMAMITALAWSAEKIAGLVEGGSRRPTATPPEQLAEREDYVEFLKRGRSTVQPANLSDYDLRISQAQAEVSQLRSQLFGSGDIEGRNAGNGVLLPSGPSAAARTAQQIELDKAQEDLDRRLRVLGASPVNRSVAQARADVAARTDLSGDITDAASEKGRAAIIAETKARAEQAVVVRDQTAAVNANVAGNMAAATAYQTSAASGIEADARRQAGVEALTQAINVNIRTREILAEKLSAELVAASQSIEANRNEVANAERLADAQKQGAAAYAEAELAIKQQTATQQLAIAVQVAEKAGLSELADGFRALKSEREEQIATIERANRATQQAIDLRRADQEVALSQQNASAAQIFDPNVRRSAEIAIDRQREYNRLLEVAKGDTKYIGEMMQRWDLKSAADEQARFWSDVRQKAEEVSKDVSQFLVDGAVNAAKGGRSAFQNLWDGALAGGKRFLAQIAAQFLQQRIILPIAMQVVGGIPQAFGIAAPAGGAAGQSGGFGISNITSFLPKGWMETVTNPILTAVDKLGLATGLGGGLVAPTAAMTASGIASSTAAATAGLAAETAIAGSTAVSGSLTGMAGLSAALPYVGAALAVAGLGMSLFGGKKPSVGPGGGAEFGVSADGKAVIGITNGDNGYDAVAQNLDPANAVGAAAKAFVEKLGGKYGGTAEGTKGGYLGSNTKSGKFSGGAAFGSPESGYNPEVSSLAEASAAALLGVLKNSVIDGLSKDLSDRLKAVTSVEGLESLLQYVEQLRAVHDTFKDWKAPLTQVETTVNDLKAAFDLAKSAAESLGKSVGPVTDSYKAQLAFLTDQFNAPLREREMRAKGDTVGADLFAFDRQAAITRKEAAALGNDAIVQAERTLAAERLAIVRRSTIDIAVSFAQKAVDILQAQYDALNDELKANTASQIADIAQVRDAWKGVATDIGRLIDSLKVGRLSPLDPQTQMLEAQRQFQDTLKRAWGGDQAAAGDVAAKAQAALEQTQSYFASGVDYAVYFDQVQAQLSSFQSMANAQATAADRQLAALGGIQSAARDSVEIQRQMAALLTQIQAAQTNVIAQQAGGGAAGANAAAAITSAYQTALGRAPDAGGAAFWANQIATGAGTTASVTNAIKNSTEAQLVKLYNEVLGRAPDAAGLAYWSSIAAGGTSLADITKSFKATAESQGIKKFAGGGDHFGGLRIVGEQGPELEATGPARIYSFDQTRRMLTGGDQGGNNAALAAAIAELNRNITALLRQGGEVGAVSVDRLDRMISELVEMRRMLRLSEAA